MADEFLGRKRVMLARPPQRVRAQPYATPATRARATTTTDDALNDLFGGRKRVTLARPAQVALAEAAPDTSGMLLDNWISEWQVATVDPRGDLFDPATGGGGIMTLPRPRQYRSLDKDPFCTDVSFFASGRYRPTAYVARDRHDAPHVVPRREPNRGPYTGAARCPGPKVHRKFGNSTRARVMPFRRYTHMSAQDGFATDVVGSEPLPSFLPSSAALGQSGSEAVLTAAHLKRTLGVGKPGATNPLLDG